MAEPTHLTTTCCIAGGGPAGMMAGLLLAGAGVDVIVLEKHADFFRDFRGDTVHPSTLEVMYELGYIDEFLQLPHQKVHKAMGLIGDYSFTPADFSHLPVHCPYIALMPQWDFLDFLARKAKQYPNFRLLLNHEVTDLLWEKGRVIGIKAKAPDGPMEVRSDLTIAADGRGSVVRAKSGLIITEIGAPFDVLWLRISRDSDDPERTLGNFRRGKALVTINRNDYWQCGYLIKKGGLDPIKARGLEAFRSDLVDVAPFLKERVHEIDSWDKVKLLTVQINRLKQWHLPGLLCIGDSAHAMSPVGGVGINLAVQDAVATANALAGPLRARHVNAHDLALVQSRREFPTKLTQGAQVFVQKHFLLPAFDRKDDASPPKLARLLNAVPWLRRIPARMIGMGVRPEHVHTPEIK